MDEQVVPTFVKAFSTADPSAVPSLSKPHLNVHPTKLSVPAPVPVPAHEPACPVPSTAKPKTDISSKQHIQHLYQHQSSPPLISSSALFASASSPATIFTSATTTTASSAITSTASVDHQPKHKKKHLQPQPGPTPSLSSEYSGKLRWQTPARTGTWLEPWASARELGTGLCVRSARAPFVSNALRATLCDAIVTYVGPHLLRRTVDKWLCLLFEYLELNVDEQILVICLLRRYARCGGRFVGHRDWIRPQRWECVIAIACYFSVLLTEEFPGRTAYDLKELLGASFHFGVEQVLFLKAVDWKICVSPEEFKDVSTACAKLEQGDMEAAITMRSWFSAETRDVSDAKVWTTGGNALVDRNGLGIEKEHNKIIKNKKKELNGVGNVITKDVHTVPDNNKSKKRSFACVDQTSSLSHHEQAVAPPPLVVPRVDPSVTIEAFSHSGVYPPGTVPGLHHQHQHPAHMQAQVQAQVQAQAHAQMQYFSALKSVNVPMTGAPTYISGINTLASLGSLGHFNLWDLNQ